jgi:parallel beta-helix repeat protein
MSSPFLPAAVDLPSSRDPRRRRRALLRLGVGVPTLAVGLLVPATTAWAAQPGTIHVSVDGSDSADCGGPDDPCRTITHGVDRAEAGGRVAVGPGTYSEQVVVTEELHLDGSDAVIDATGLQSGSGPDLDAAALLLTPTASGSSVEGFTVRGAYGEGVLVLSATDVQIAHNTVTGNDLGTPSSTPYLECQPQGDVPGDCGEGLHLMSARDSAVVDNEVTDNSGGILVTDEFGPASGNRIIGNLARDNSWDCGITLPSHNPNALAADGTRQADRGGVYDNVVAHNAVVHNGAKAEGAGVLVAAAGPGMASYDNRIVGNEIRDNGMPGVTVHSHTPNQDVSGNVIAGNDIGPNNLNGDEDAKDTATTGILVFSAVVPVSETVAGNDIHGNQIPIWTSPNVTLH